MFSIDDLSYHYEPYPIGYKAEIFSAEVYEQLAVSYPAIELFKHKPDTGNKYSLSELNNPENYHKFLKQNPVWLEFYNFVKDENFVHDVLDKLQAANIDLGYKKIRVRNSQSRRASSFWSRLRRRTELRTRFEFSALDGNGGHLKPHTDHHNKVVTLVLSMNKANDWDKNWGGGTQVCLPKDRTRVFNHINRYFEFDDVETLNEYSFLPNQCILFVKTYNSWHQVAPLRAAQDSALRKTLTINIEKLS